MVAPAPRAVGVARVSRVGLKVRVVARLGSGWRGVARREVVSFLAMDFRRRGWIYSNTHHHVFLFTASSLIPSC